MQLSYTLNALSTALEGRGDRLGENLVRLDSYLKQLNPLVPSIVRDLRLLAKVSDLYRDVLPDLATTLDNQVVTGNTVVDKQRQLAALFDDVAGFSDTTRDFLQANGDNIIRLGQVSLPTLDALADYAPEYPCLTQGLANWIPQMSEAYRDYTLHITLETIPNQPTGYGTADDPEYGADNGPHCESLPNPPYSQANPAPQPAPGEVDDGVESSHGKFRAAPGYDPSVRPDVGLVRHRGRAAPRRRARRAGHAHRPRERPRHRHPAARAHLARDAGEPAMKLLDAKTTVDAVKLTVFMVVTSLATGLLVITIGNVTFGAVHGVQGCLQRRHRPQHRRRRPDLRRPGRIGEEHRHLPAHARPW